MVYGVLTYLAALMSRPAVTISRILTNVNVMHRPLSTSEKNKKDLRFLKCVVVVKHKWVNWRPHLTSMPQSISHITWMSDLFAHLTK